MRMMFCRIDLDSPGIVSRGFVALCKSGFVKLLSFIIMKMNDSVRRYVSSFESPKKLLRCWGFVKCKPPEAGVVLWLRGPPPELHLVLAAVTGRALRGHGGALSVSNWKSRCCRNVLRCCKVLGRTSFDSPCFVNNWHLDWKPWFSSTSLVRRSN